MGLKITGVKFSQYDNHFIIGYARAGDLLRQTKIDEWNPENPNGYQRGVIERRAKEFGNFLAKKGISPNAVLLNIRDVDINNIKKITENKYEIPEDISLWIVDGQHRLKGLEFASNNQPELLDTNIPLVIMNLKSHNPDLARQQEATQFFIINKTEKGMRTDRAEPLMLQVEEEVEDKAEGLNLEKPTFLRKKSEFTTHEEYTIPAPARNMPATNRESTSSHKYYINYQKNQHQVLPTSLRREIKWKPRATRIVDLINTRKDSPLKGRIKLPNFRPRGTTVSQVSMVSALKNVLNTAPFEEFNDDTLASVMINLWIAVKEICPEPFREVKTRQRADEYVLLKTTGIFVIPKLLLGLSLYLPRENEYPVYTVDIFKKFLYRAGELMEADFWRSSGPGTAGALGTGQKSFSYIAQLIMRRITSKGDGQGKSPKVIV